MKLVKLDLMDTGLRCQDFVERVTLEHKPDEVVRRIADLTRVDLEVALRKIQDSLEDNRLPAYIDKQWNIHTIPQFHAIHLINFAVAQGINEVLKVTHPEVAYHSEFVGYVATRIATVMGLSQEETCQIGGAAFTHDVGKISFSSDFLDSGRRFKRIDTKTIQAHTVLGGKILRNGFFPELYPQSAEGHHENFDGTGYTSGLKGEEIPLISRIMRVADSYAAATDRSRVYKKALKPEEALLDIQEKIESWYDPEAVRGLTGIFNQIKQHGNN